MPVINFLFFFFILVIDPIRYRQLNPPYVIDNPCQADPICNGHGTCSQEGTVCNCLHGYTGNGCGIPPYYHTTTKKSGMYSC